MKQLDFAAARARGIRRAQTDFSHNHIHYIKSLNMYQKYLDMFREDVERASANNSDFEQKAFDEVYSHHRAGLIVILIGIILLGAGALSFQISHNRGLLYCALISALACFIANIAIRAATEAAIRDAESKAEVAACAKEHYRLIKTLTPPSA